MAHHALPPPRRAMCTRALCDPTLRPGALHVGALHVGGAPSGGLIAGVSGPDAPDPGTDLHVGSLARLATAHQALSPSRRAVCTLALSGCSCVLELSALALSMLAALPAVVSELAMLRTRISSSCRHPGPTGQGSPSSVSSAGCRAHAVPVLPAAAPWSRNWSISLQSQNGGYLTPTSTDFPA